MRILRNGSYANGMIWVLAFEQLRVLYFFICTRNSESFRKPMNEYFGRSEGSDEMLGLTVRHFSRVCAVILMQYYLEIITCDPSIYTMDYFKFILSNKQEESTKG